MKKLLVLLFICVSISAFSQKKLEVVSFNMSTSDISARTNQREDTNGEACALIKVQLPIPHAIFEGNVIGRVEHKTNEYWVYMPQNSIHLDIKLEGYSTKSLDFKDCGVPKLESKATYELCVLPKEPNAPQLYDEGMTALAKNDMITAYEKLENAANSGYAYANYILGSIQVQPYEIPEGQEWIEDPNPGEAYQAAYNYYKKAAEANIPEALYALGTFLTQYNENKGTDRDPWDPNIYKAKISPEDCSPAYISSLIRKAADLGVADAQWMMCKEKKWCEENANKGIAIAEFAMGLRCDTTFYDDTYDYPKAEEIIPNEEEQRLINYGEAYKWYSKAAEKGLDAAQWKLGYMYALGLGVEKNLEKSMYWRKKAAEQGYIVYQLEMAMSYNYGVISDLSTYESWGTAENGMPAWDAKISINADDADYWLHKVSNRELITTEEKGIIDGNSMYCDAMYMLAEQFKKKENYGKAVYWYQRTGEMDGDASSKKYALGELGRIFLEGLDVEKDYSKAKRYLERGVEVEGFEAACYLGLIYRDGLGIEKDLETAKGYFMKSINFQSWEPQPYYELANTYYQQAKYEDAAKYYQETIQNRGDEDGDNPLFNKYGTLAYFKLGLMYLNGVGIEVDKDKAVDYIGKAAYRGNQDAKTKLKELGLPENYGEILHNYELGKDKYDHKHYDEAVKMFRLSAEQGYAPAQYYMGVCYDKGRGFSPNKTEAARWYRLAAEQDHTEAQFNLGYAYLMGEGVSLDYSEGAKWTRLAAEKGYRSAQDNMGWCYELGKGVPVNYSEAVRWYKLAAKQNSSYAIKQLKRLNEM